MNTKKNTELHKDGKEEVERRTIHEVLLDLADAEDAPTNAPEQEGECNHYFAQDGICIYCHAPLAASGGGEDFEQALEEAKP